MDVLNQNQRRSALWRIAAIMGIMLAVVSVVLWAMGSTIKGGGEKQVQELRDSLTNVRTDHDARIIGLENQIKSLTKNLELASSDESLQKLIEDQKKEIKNLESELDVVKEEYLRLQLRQSSNP